jgi:hypothetical protein
MVSLATMGMLDTSFLVPLQVYQTILIDMVKSSLMAVLLPTRLVWDEGRDAFIYAYEATGGCIA